MTSWQAIGLNNVKWRQTLSNKNLNNNIEVFTWIFSINISNCFVITVKKLQKLYLMQWTFSRCQTNKTLTPATVFACHYANKHYNSTPKIFRWHRLHGMHPGIQDLQTKYFLAYKLRCYINHHGLFTHVMWITLPSISLNVADELNSNLHWTYIRIGTNFNITNCKTAC